VICQPFAGSGWCNQHPGVASTYLLFIRRVKQCSEQSGCFLELPDNETSNLLHSSSFQAAASYILVLLTLKSLLLHCKVFIKALSISYSSFLAEPQERWSETAWKVQIISVILVERWLFSSQKCAITLIIRKAYHFFFGYQSGDQEKGWAQYTTYVLQYLCSKPSKLIESHKAINVFCHIHGIKRVDGR